MLYITYVDDTMDFSSSASSSITFKSDCNNETVKKLDETISCMLHKDLSADKTGKIETFIKSCNAVYHLCR